MQALKFPAYKIFALIVVLLSVFHHSINESLGINFPDWLRYTLYVTMFTWITYEKHREGKLKQWLLFAVGLIALVALIGFLQLVVFA